VISVEHLEIIDDFSAFGIQAFTTTRAVGSFSFATAEPARDVAARWDALRATAAARGVRRLATARQVHGVGLLTHAPGWDGWLRGSDADGHVARNRGTAVAISVADCVPVCIAHPSGALALLHSGWRGTASRIVERGIHALRVYGCDVGDLAVHLGPAICGRCYEVGAEVAERLLGAPNSAPRFVDLRALIADHARMLGVRRVSVSSRCTKCDNDRFFSHRAGDDGRQLTVMFAHE
jgi:polyphenol oxidase